MMGGCGSVCDCLQGRATRDVEPTVENPFKPTKAHSGQRANRSNEIYYIVESPRPNGLRH